MACNCGKKSCAQKYNFAAQALTTTPAPLNMGATAGLPTGPAIVDRSNNIGIAHTGLYRLTAQLTAAVTAAGTLNVQAYYNGVALASTLKTIPVAVGSTQINLDNLLYLVVPDGCDCVNVVYPIDIYAWVSDSAAASVTAVAVNALKEA